MKILTLMAALFLSGCALFGPNPQLTAAQMKAAAGDNKNTAVCNSFPIMGGIAKIVILSEDQTRNVNGSITVEGNCDKITMSTDTVLPPPKMVTVPPAPPLVVTPVPVQTK